MATKMFEVQQKIFSSLKSSVELSKLVTGVFDYVPEKAKTPYVTFGQILSTSENTKTDKGEKLNFFLEIWSESKGRKESVQILTLIEKALEVEFEMDSTFIIEQKTINREVVEEAYGLYHATLEFQVILEWEE